jgi:hypothetical protein
VSVDPGNLHTLTLAVGEAHYRGAIALRTQKKKLVYP